MGLLQLLYALIDSSFLLSERACAQRLTVFTVQCWGVSLSSFQNRNDDNNNNKKGTSKQGKPITIRYKDEANTRVGATFFKLLSSFFIYDNLRRQKADMSSDPVSYPSKHGEWRYPKVSG